MPVNYTVQADVVDITTDSPQKGDIFLVDTNIWYWLTYPQASSSLRGCLKSPVVGSKTF
jgi:hypothetical protein